MRILLTGSNGYIGKHLESLLVIVYGKESVQGFDVCGDPALWKSSFDEEILGKKFDVIIHAGAIRLPQYNQPDIWWWNYWCTKQIADHAKAHESTTKFIFFSTCMAINPISFYGWTKQCGADYVSKTLDNHAIIRPFNVYGREEGTLNKYSPVWRLIRGELPYCFNPWIRDYIHVQDLCAGIVHIIRNDLTGDYDLGTGNGVSTMELVDLWDGQRPPIVGPGEEGWPENASEVLVARPEKMLPDFVPAHDVKKWLAKLKATTLG